MVSDTIFSNSDNEIKLLLLDPNVKDVDNPKGTPYTFISNGITLMELFISNFKFSSADNQIIYDDDGVITLKLSGVESIPKNIAFSASIKIYDPAHVNGQFIVNNAFRNSALKLTVVDPTIC